MAVKALTRHALWNTASAGAPASHLGQPSQSSLETLIGGAANTTPIQLTVSVGASLFDDRFGLAAMRPDGLEAMPDFVHDQLDTERCHGDLLVQISGESEAGCLAVVRRIARDVGSVMRLRWSASGFAGVESRNLLGFVDGTGNPSLTNHSSANDFPFMGGSAQPWADGGSMLAVRLISFDTAAWDDTPTSSQESVIGRHKVSDTRLDESGVLRSHVGRLNADGHSPIPMLRRSYNSAIGAPEQGLIFIAYQPDFAAGFLRAQSVLAGEELARYATTHGGGFFFTLPGLADSDDWYGRRLLT